ncbi:hypothetical protein PIB30_001039 [Stylosanthes scabra]|uniref:Uncharacterized protein n=1 Tax=Stylosanthes scabra TaxID=79078 RepID=A0ABU6T2R6_9FABA|nr:hypothetical protein [Stylosanthes scabra]
MVEEGEKFLEEKMGGLTIIRILMLEIEYGRSCLILGSATLRRTPSRVVVAVLDVLPASTVVDLREIATRMVEVGFGNACARYGIGKPDSPRFSEGGYSRWWASPYH